MGFEKSHSPSATRMRRSYKLVPPCGAPHEERGVNSGNGSGASSSWDRPASRKTSPVRILTEVRHTGHRERDFGVPAKNRKARSLALTACIGMPSELDPPCRTHSIRQERMRPIWHDRSLAHRAYFGRPSRVVTSGTDTVTTQTSVSRPSASYVSIGHVSTRPGIAGPGHGGGAVGAAGDVIVVADEQFPRIHAHGRPGEVAAPQH